jgi:hypothetical protein
MSFLFMRPRKEASDTTPSSSAQPSSSSMTDQPSSSTSNPPEEAELGGDEDSVRGLATTLSSTSLNNYNPWARGGSKGRADPVLSLRRSWRTFISTENTERLRRGEFPFCSREGRDAAFAKLLRVMSGEEPRDNGHRADTGAWDWDWEGEAGEAEDQHEDKGGETEEDDGVEYIEDISREERVEGESGGLSLRRCSDWDRQEYRDEKKRVDSKVCEE